MFVCFIAFIIKSNNYTQFLGGVLSSGLYAYLNNVAEKGFEKGLTREMFRLMFLPNVCDIYLA